MQDGLLPQERVQAIQEEIIRFLLEHVIDPKGEYYYPVHLKGWSVKKRCKLDQTRVSTVCNMFWPSTTDATVYIIYSWPWCVIYIVVTSLLMYICSTIKLNTKPCRDTKIARNAAAAETNDLGSCHESGPMIHPTRCARAHVETHRFRFVLEPGPALVLSNWSPMARTNRDERGGFPLVRASGVPLCCAPTDDAFWPRASSSTAQELWRPRPQDGLVLARQQQNQRPEQGRSPVACACGSEGQVVSSRGHGGGQGRIWGGANGAVAPA
jgi:hypothetical protein